MSNCSLSTNNVLNPFTPFGDCSMVRMANLYANIAQVGAQSDIRECFSMVTDRPAKLMRLKNYGIGSETRLTCSYSIASASRRRSRKLLAPLYGFKRGKKTFTRPPVEIHWPG